MSSSGTELSRLALWGGLVNQFLLKLIARAHAFLFFLPSNSPLSLWETGPKGPPQRNDGVNPHPPMKGRRNWQSDSVRYLGFWL